MQSDPVRNRSPLAAWLILVSAQLAAASTGKLWCAHLRRQSRKRLIVCTPLNSVLGEGPSDRNSQPAEGPVEANADEHSVRDLFRGCHRPLAAVKQE